MVEVYSKGLKKTTTAQRILTKLIGEEKGATVVFFAGIHGNEPAGIFALQETLRDVKESEIRGNIYAISGNLKALEEGKRFLSQDLNRLWYQENIDMLLESHGLIPEHNELLELFRVLNEILDSNEGPFYFIDLHTTSSKTIPFITINDSIINRKFSEQFPVPKVLGIEEYLNGPLLSYINTLGYVSLGFESGQHDSKNAIKSNIAFINLVLKEAGVFVNQKTEKDFKRLKKITEGINDVYEVIYLHKIESSDDFEILPGFKSFETIKRGSLIAKHNDKFIESRHNARIFMPLYQNKGNEGFFIIKQIPSFFLKLSLFLRNIKADNLLASLPGVTWHNKKEGVLKVNLKTAKFLAKPIFHLLGYRSKQADETHLFITNRERVSKTNSYKNESWFK